MINDAEIHGLGQPESSTRAGSVMFINASWIRHVHQRELDQDRHSNASWIRIVIPTRAGPSPLSQRELVLVRYPNASWILISFQRELDPNLIPTRAGSKRSIPTRAGSKRSIPTRAGSWYHSNASWILVSFQRELVLRFTTNASWF